MCSCVCVCVCVCVWQSVSRRMKKKTHRNQTEQQKTWPVNVCVCHLKTNRCVRLAPDTNTHTHTHTHTHTFPCNDITHAHSDHNITIKLFARNVWFLLFIFIFSIIHETHSAESLTVLLRAIKQNVKPRCSYHSPKIKYAEQRPCERPAFETVVQYL